MTQKFTAEEVREKAHGYSLRGDSRTAAMLDTLAERIEADEGAVPVAWISHRRVVGIEDKDFYGQLPIQSLQPGFYSHTPLFTRPKGPVIVPPCVSADDANRLYGEAFGVDWEYESITAKSSSKLHPPTQAAQVPAELADFVRGMHTLELYNASTSEPYFDCNGSDMWCSTEDFAGKDGEKFVRFLFGCAEFVKAQLNGTTTAEPVAQPTSPDAADSGRVGFDLWWCEQKGSYNRFEYELSFRAWQAALAVQPQSAASPAGVPDGWKLAMFVLQSGMYAKLPEEERAVCDALIAENPFIAAPSAPEGE